MTTLILAAFAIGLRAPAFAQPASCTVQATDRELAGAAKTSFTTKCVKDAVGA